MNKLKIIREKNNLTKQELANAIGVTVRYIAFIEQGKRTPSLEIASKIAIILNSSIDNIFISNLCTKSTYEKEIGTEVKKIKRLNR
ncbi:helix-turn-helix transcriptional regulator [Pectinatus haikarae]|uniref:helix-turn-helix transcriptional regulator n=1 Tax=Pectinatus haikarae TaxID=349096 RepID=UPI0018C5B0B7|nr:helix-turn-helix transcriptional regulator [Pectinatus haikarae]